MKITIELEIQPDEVGLAAELLSTLRSLTDHVKVITPAGGSPNASAVVPTVAPSGPSPAPASAANAVPNGTGAYPGAPRPGAPSPPAPPSAPAPQPAAPAAQPAAPAPAPAPQVPQQLGHPQDFKLIVPRLGNPATQDQAVADAVATLRSAGANIDRAAEDLVAAFEQCVFDNPEVINSPAGVLPYMTLYQRLPEDLRTKVREKMVAKVLTSLTKKRPTNAERIAFFGYADAFATLVKFEAVPMEGAVQTLSRLLVKPDTRCAGVTMLGKTVEYCGEQLLRVPEAHLAALWRSLESVKEEVFHYDLQYILGSLGRLVPPGSQAPSAPAAPAAAPADPSATAGAAAPPAVQPVSTGGAAPAAAPVAGPMPTAMTHLGCYQGHSATVFTLCYDATYGQLSSGGQDGQLLVWGHDGTPVSRMDVSSHFVCSLDVLPRSGTLLAAAIPNPDKPTATAEAPCVLGFTPPGAAPGAQRVGPWNPRGRLYGVHRGIISFVRALGGDGEVFAIGENSASTDSSVPSKDVVCLYDASRGGPLEQLTPLTVYAEHREMVTCAAPWNVNPNVFVSGGRDAAIRVWDRRMPQSVGSFGELDSASGTVKAHADMVTCLDTTDNLLLSTSVDGYMCIWDFRNLNMAHGSVAGPIVKLQIDTQPTLKVAVTGAPHSRLAAISTYQGLYVMDFTNMSAPTTVIAPPFADGRPFKYYHDIRWAGGAGAPGQPVLFGASDDPKIDLFSLVF